MESKEKKDGQHSESSLLLQPPGSLLSWSNMSENSLFMPVAVQTSGAVQMEKESKGQISSGTSVVKTNEPLFTPTFTSAQYGASSGSLSQLQQPLMVRKSPSPGSQAYCSSANLPPSSPLSEGNSHPGLFEIVQGIKMQNVPSPAMSNLPQSFYYEPTNIRTDEPFPYVPHKQAFCALPTTVPPSPSPSNRTRETQLDGSIFPSSSQRGFETAEKFSDLMSNAAAKCNYKVIEPHWFYREIIETKEMWYGFSRKDSRSIEDAFDAFGKNLHEPNQDDIVVSTDGGRYDVYIKDRIKRAVYWDELDIHVRRCTWFHKSEGLQRFLPYDEMTSSLLEQLFYNCLTSGNWQQKLILDGGEVVIMEGPQTIFHYAHGLDAWPTVSDSKSNPKIVIRGVPEETVIEDDETTQIDHLVFIVQGIGSVCDLRFRTVSQCVDGFREIANRLISVHFKNEVESGKVGRIEFLPLAWHSTLHTNHMGLDRRLQSITLPSIPKLRHFTNDTLLDILLYSSPTYCQAIMDTVGSSLNKLHNLFISRNPGFNGKISVAGHSLGSLILFDILANQSLLENKHQPTDNKETLEDINLVNNPVPKYPDVDGSGYSGNENVPQIFNTSSTSIESVLEELGLQEYLNTFQTEKINLDTLMYCDESALKDLGLPMGPRKMLLAFLKHQQTKFASVDNSQSVTANLDHQHVPVNITDQAQSIPAVVSTVLDEVNYTTSIYPINQPKICLSSVSFPRLDFHPTCFFALGSPISMFLAVRGFSTISEDFRFPTCSAFFHIFHPYDPVAFRIEPLIDPKFSAEPVLIPHHKGRKRMHIEIRENITKMGIEIKQKVLETLRYTWDSLSVFAKAHTFPTAAVEAEVDKYVQEQMSSESEDECQASSTDPFNENLRIGCLNGGRRIDYVLQEKPIEALNEYIFALTSHATYWDSEDTVLMILKEVYAVQGITPQPLTTESNQPKLAMNQSSGMYIPSSVVSSETFVNSSDYLSNSYAGASSPSQSSYLSESTLPIQSSSSSNFNDKSVTQSSPMLSQPIGPPPLSGFVKKSPFSKS